MTTTQEAGKKGAEIRNKNLSPEERSEASRRAAETRKQEDPDAFVKMGKKGGEHSHGGHGGRKEDKEE